MKPHPKYLSQLTHRLLFDYLNNNTEHVQCADTIDKKTLQALCSMVKKVKNINIDGISARVKKIF